jgi:hypothetical protein
MDSTAGQGLSAATLTRSRVNRDFGQRPRRSPHRLHLNTEPFKALMAQRGKNTADDIAAYLDLGYGTVYNALRGRPISDAFVSALMKVLHTNQSVGDYLIPARTEVAAA